MHVHLQVGRSSGKPVFEPVHVNPLGEKTYRVLFSPGLAYGIAADDEIQLLDDGQYEVTRRGRNLAVRVLSAKSLSEHAHALTDQVRERLGGRLDGQTSKGLAFTVPVSAGFQAVEALFEQFVANQTGVVWEYGNVYDENGKPIGWWHSEA